MITTIAEHFASDPSDHMETRLFVTAQYLCQFFSSVTCHCETKTFEIFRLLIHFLGTVKRNINIKRKMLSMELNIY